MITPEDEKRFNLRPLPDVQFIGHEEGQARRATYEAGRRQHRAIYPIVESAGPFVITPELEQERAERISGRQWREPEHALSEADIEILQLKGVI